MFLLPIAQDVRLKGHFPWLTFVIIAACIGIHVSAQSDHELVLEALELQRVSRSPGVRFDVPIEWEGDMSSALRPRMKDGVPVRSMPLDEALPLLIERDPIVRWQYHPGHFDLNVVRYAFVHADWAHLLTNMLLLLLTGVPLERRFGARRFSSLYTAGAIAGALAFGLTHTETPEIGLLGASGAVAALMGAFCYFFFSARFTFFYLVLLIVYPVWGTFRAPAWVVLPLWLLTELAMVALGQDALSPVAHSAHVAGFMTGLLVALLWQAFLPDLRIRYSRLRTQVAARPADLVAREAAFATALELNALTDAQRDLQRAIKDEFPAATVVSFYRRLREHAPDFVLKGRQLAHVRRAALELGDPQVQVETTNRLCGVMPLGSRLSSWLREAAAAQDALGRPELAAQTRNFLWEAGYTLEGRRRSGLPEGPGSSQEAVSAFGADSSTLARPEGAQPVQVSSWPPDKESMPPTISMRPDAKRCDEHGLAAIAHCCACERPVCAVCSVKEAGGARRCKTCLEVLSAERPASDGAALGVRLLGSLAMCLAVLTPGLIPILMLSGAEGLRVVLAVAILEAVWLGVAGYGLCFFRPWSRLLMMVGLVVQVLGGTVSVLSAEGPSRGLPLFLVCCNLGLLVFLARPQVAGLFHVDAVSNRKRMNLPVGIPIVGWFLIALGAASAVLLALMPRLTGDDFAERLAATPAPGSLPVDVPQMLPDGVPFRLHVTYARKHWPATSASPLPAPELHIEFSARGRAAQQTGSRTTAIELADGTLIVREAGHERSCGNLQVMVTAPFFEMRSPNHCDLLEEPKYVEALKIQVLNQNYSLAWAFPEAGERKVGQRWDLAPSARSRVSREVFADHVARRFQAGLEIRELATCGRQTCAVVEMDLSGSRDTRLGAVRGVEQCAARERLLLPLDPQSRSYAWERRAETRTRTPTGAGVDVVLLRREELVFGEEGILFDAQRLSTAPPRTPAEQVEGSL